MGAIGLSRDGAERCEFRRGEAHAIIGSLMRVFHLLQLRLFRRGGKSGLLAELGEFGHISDSIYIVLYRPPSLASELRATLLRLNSASRGLQRRKPPEAE